MPELAELLASAPRLAPFTSDDPSAFCSRDPLRGYRDDHLLVVADFFHRKNPDASWRAFTRWLSA